jgi:hypothetical protein
MGHHTDSDIVPNECWYLGEWIIVRRASLEQQYVDAEIRRRHNQSMPPMGGSLLNRAHTRDLQKVDSLQSGLQDHRRPLRCQSISRHGDGL